MKTDIKICGLKTPDAIERALLRGATHLGFIFFEKSPRHITPSLAASLVAPARGQAHSVAVTVDASDAMLDEIVTLLRPDLLQLHGHESVDRVAAVKARYQLPVMKAFSVRTREDLNMITEYQGIADRFLFDAKPPAGSQLPGGNGVSFDWKLMHALDESTNYMLSGGINKNNVALALASTRARGIDISSGIESAPGVKDMGMMDQFFDAVAKAQMSAAGSST